MSIRATLARAAANSADDAWQLHRKSCPGCGPAARTRACGQLCARGAGLLRERDSARADAKAEAEADRQPHPGQGTLFGD